jgi:rod shape determining protein RodA
MSGNYGGKRKTQGSVMSVFVPRFTESWKKLPFSMLSIVGVLSVIGFIVLASADGGNVSRWALPQMVRFVVGCIMLLGICVIRLEAWMKYAYGLYAITIIMLIVVELMGHIGMGAQRWIDLGIIKLQPSELAKITVILTLARHFHNTPPTKYNKIQHLIIPLLIIALPVALILKQPNLGTATLLCGIAGWLMFASGIHRKYFIIGIVLVCASLPVGWQFMHDYQKQRVMTFLDPESDPLGSGYNITQSMIAIGSGGITGKGLMNGSQTQLDFLPEKQTDFIFTVLSEEFGFIGGATIIILYMFMILKIISIASHSKSLFGTLVAHGIAALLTLHMFINIGMVIGLLPVVGIPLPLLSYGGSIMISTMIALGLVCNVAINKELSLRAS